MNEISDRKIMRVYAAVTQCTQALPFDPREARFVCIARCMTKLYSKFNEPPRYFENEGFEKYLSRYSAEEIAGHVRLYELEWWGCEPEDNET